MAAIAIADTDADTGGLNVQGTIAALAPAHEVITVPDLGAPGRDALMQQCFDVRIAVFVHEQGFPLEAEIDAEDETATHFLLRLVPSLTPIGTVRCCVKPRGKDADTAIADTMTLPPHAAAYKLGRLAVLAPYRKHKLGRALVLALHSWAQHDAVNSDSDSGSGSGRAGHSLGVPAPGGVRGLGGPGRTISLIAHSQLPVKAFYAKFGYEPEGDEFEEDGAPHQKMVLRLPVPIPVIT